MNKRVYTGAPYQATKETQEITGLSQRALHEGARKGKFPHEKSGSRILFNVPGVLDVLEEMAKTGGTIND